MLATAGEGVCVCDLTPNLGLSQPTVSHHLRKLAEAGLLRQGAARHVGVLLAQSGRARRSCRSLTTFTEA